MPALPSVPGAISIKFRFTDAASIDSGFGFHLSYTEGPPSGGDMGSIANSAESSWATNVQGDMPTDLTLVEVTATDLSSATGAVGTWIGSDPGGTSGTIISSGACFCINHVINRRYRGGKPKTFVPGVLPVDLDGTNKISAARQTSLGNSWGAFVAGLLATGGLTIVLQNIVSVSYYEGFTVVTNPVTGRSRNVPKLRDSPLVDVIHSSAVAQKLGSQRRRLNL